MHMKFPLFAFVALVCIGTVLLAGCTAPAEKPLPTPVPTPSPVPGESVFDLAVSGRTFNISLDEEFQLRLPENPSTGYTWMLTVPEGLSITNETYIPDDASGRLVGSGGTRVWSLKAVQPGVQVITGVYSRPWESRLDSGALFFNLTLVVGGSTCTTATCTVPGVPARFHVYTEEDDGRTVEEAPGETFTIRLRENPSTGYSWNLSLSEGLDLTGDEYIPSQAGGQVVGGGGIRSFSLGATKPGEEQVAAEYRRPWMKSGTVASLDLEGGFFGIIGDDGEQYEPLNLDEKYREDGLRVAFDAEPAKDVATIHMWGTPVNLVHIEEIQAFTLTVMVK